MTRHGLNPRPSGRGARQYFLRGVGEAPAVTYDAGVYTVSGLMQTTHPGDRSPVTVFDDGSEPASLDFCTAPDRQAMLRGMYDGRGPRWDGRDER